MVWKAEANLGWQNKTRTELLWELDICQAGFALDILAGARGQSDRFSLPLGILAAARYPRGLDLDLGLDVAPSSATPTLAGKQPVLVITASMLRSDWLGRARC